MLRLAHSTAAAIDSVLIVHLLVSLSHDGLCQVVGLVDRGLHRPDKHISVVSIIIHGRDQPLFPRGSNIRNILL